MHRAKLDKNGELHNFCEVLERAVIETVENGYMTKDLALCISEGKEVNKSKYCTTEGFLNRIKETLVKNLSGNPKL